MSKKETPWFLTITGLLGFVIGTQFFANIIIPLIGFIAGLTFVNKIMIKYKKELLLAISLQIGQVFAIVFAYILKNEQVNVLGYLDIALLSVLIIWLICKPGVISTVVSIIYQISSIAVNIYILSSLSNIQTDIMKSFLFAIIYKMFVLLFLANGLYSIEKNKYISESTLNNKN